GFLKQGRGAVAAGTGLGESVRLRECASCGQPTTSEVCAYCRMSDRGRVKAAAKAERYAGSR
ncbi:MAG TPA: tRNA(Ile)-lysidine synthetase, partial [Candidatus Dormibacteraeota bacterium]